MSLEVEVRQEYKDNGYSYKALVDLYSGKMREALLEAGGNVSDIPAEDTHEFHAYQKKLTVLHHLQKYGALPRDPEIVKKEEEERVAREEEAKLKAEEVAETKRKTDEAEAERLRLAEEEKAAALKAQEELNKASTGSTPPVVTGSEAGNAPATSSFFTPPK